MDGIQRYEITYTQTAIADIDEKADYITFQLHDLNLAETWYSRLRDQIQDGLSSFPLKYPLYDVEPWREQGVRIFVTRNDVVLYTAAHIVYIHVVCTRGRDLSAHLTAVEQDR